MTSIHERFAALPRARRGSETMIIASERELAELIGDAQASEAELISRRAPRDIGEGRFDELRPRVSSFRPFSTIYRSPGM